MRRPHCGFRSEPLEPRRLLSSYHLTFDDEFNTLKMASGPTTHGWLPYDYWNDRYYAGNGEQQYYCNPAADAYNPFSISNGILSITAMPTPNGVSADGQPYVSGELTSATGSQWSDPKSAGFGQQYGYFELRVKLPAGKGFWPAFWLLPADASWPPEYDIFEVLGNDPTTIYQTSHWKDGAGVHQSQGFSYQNAINSSTGFHTYGFLWDATTIKWYVDGVLAQTQVNRVDAPMYILINLAVGGTWPGNPDATTPFPSSMDVDYMRVYSSNAADPAVTPDGGYVPAPNLPITVDPVSVNAPTDITLSNASVAEGKPAGTVVGSLSSTDADVGDTFTYSLVGGAGSTDNNLFATTGDQLTTAAVFDAATQSSYSIRVRTTDSGGSSFEKVFAINVTADQTPPVVSLVSAPNLSWRDLGKSSTDVVVRFHGVTLDPASINGDEITVSGAGGPLVVTLAGTTMVDAGTIDATYHLVPPGGTWTGDDDGTYTITAVAGGFTNAAGTPNALTSLGTFTVAVSMQNPQTLYVNGTLGNDTIAISIQDLFYRVVLNGAESWYPGNQVSGISVRGFAGNDTISAGPDIMGVTIDGGTGNDSITGGDGNDSIRGDAGNDTIIGGLGDDTLMGNTEDDSIIGGAGADSIMAGLGADTVDGGAGNDILLAGDGRDWVLGSAGDDYIEGRGKMDTIYAGTGNDTIWGGAGSDLIYGEDGDDLIDVGVSTVFHDTVDGGAGTDLIRSDSDDLLTNCEGVWPV